MNKKLLISILLCCILPISNSIFAIDPAAFDEPQEDTSTSKNAPTGLQRAEMQGSKKTDEPKPIVTAKQDISSQTQESEPEPTRQVRFNIKKYQGEDLDTAKARETENNELTREWAEKQRIAKEYRNKEKFFTRALKALSADGTTDKQIEQTRNLVRLDINRQRLQEDFATRKKRFDEFKEKHMNFSEKEPFKSLIKLNDMTEFTSMSHEDRTAALQNIRTQITENLSAFLKPNSDIDLDALEDLINLTKLYEPKTPSSFTPTLKLEFDKMTAEQKESLKTKLIENLTKSLDVSLQAFEKYNKAMEDVKGDVKNLENMRDVTNSALIASMITGTAAAIAVLAHNPAMFHVIHLGLEQLLITAKVGLVAGHLGEHAEATMARNLQNTFKTKYESILPETTALLEAATYKNEADGIGQRAKEWLRGKISGTFVERAGNWIGDQVAKVAKTGWGTENGMPVTIGEHATRAGNWVADKLSKGAKGALKGVLAVRDGYRSAKKSIKTTLGIADKPDTTDTSEYNLNVKPQDDQKYADLTTRSNALINRIIQLTKDIDAETDPIKKYQLEDELLQKQREQADLRRQKREYLEDKHATALRDKESLGTRIYKKFVTDAATDKEIEMTRNKLIEEENVQRLQEDFKIRRTRFIKFQTDHAEFSETKPFTSLIDLNSNMQKFVDMSVEDRTTLLSNIEAEINTFIKSTDQEFDLKALRDLLQLTKLYEPKDLKFSQQLSETLSSDFTGKEPGELADIQSKLVSMLKESMKLSMINLKAFNEAMETIESDKTELEKVRAKTNLANGVAIITCTAAIVCIVAKPVGHLLSTVHAGVEELAIATKAGLLRGHVGEHSEAQLAKALQTKWTDTMGSILPETTKLIETISYESKAKGVSHRLISSVIGEDSYQKAHNWLTDKKENARKAFTSTVEVVKTKLKSFRSKPSNKSPLTITNPEPSSTVTQAQGATSLSIVSNPAATAAAF